MKKLLTRCSAVLSVVVLSGCGGGGGSAPPATPIISTGQYGPFQLTLSAKSSYARGEQVPLTLTMTNNQARTVQAAIGIEDGTVSRNNQVIWQRTKTSGYFDGKVLTSFAPGQSQTFEVTWDQTDLQGHSVAPGQYSAKVWVTSGAVDGTLIPTGQDENALTAPPVTITVR